MAYPSAMKSRAYQLSLSGSSVREIKDILQDEYQCSGLSEQTIYKWMKGGDWKGSKMSLETDAMIKTRTDQVSKVLDRSDAHQRTYQQLVDKAGDSLFDESTGLNFTNAMDSTRALDIGIQGERKIASAMISSQLVEDLLNSIFNIVEDENTRYALANEFKKVLSKWADSD